jgi:hypothetical protein
VCLSVCLEFMWFRGHGQQTEAILLRGEINSMRIRIVVFTLFLGLLTVMTEDVLSLEVRPTIRLDAQKVSAKTGYDPSLFSALRWRSIGPNRGGRSIACAGSLRRPMEYYFGATGGGTVEDHGRRDIMETCN